MIDTVLTLSGLLVLVPSAVLLTEIVAARPRREGAAGPGGDDGSRGRAAVLVPAHDEELVLGETLTSIGAQLRSGDALWVVADCCTDRTEQIARDFGAQVARRDHPTLRGKGYALLHGIDRLREDPPDTLVVIDADCALGPGALDALVTAAGRSGRPCQATYLLEPDDEGAGLGAPSALAILIKNRVRPLGLSRLGLPCPLTGSGMAFPWAIASEMPVSGGHLVEDMQLGIDLARRGHAACFVPEARITSRLPTSEQAALTQRRRWEHGHLQTLLVEGPRLLIESALRARWKSAALALDLMVPPLSLFVLATAGFTGVAALWWIFGGSVTPLGLGAASLAGVVIAVGLAWLWYGRSVIGWQALAAAPYYAARKLPLYLSFPFRREKRWTRTERRR